MAKEVRVKIRKDPPPNSRSCKSDPDPFKAKRGDFVTFDFDNEPGVRIVFSGESPFDASNKFEPKRMEVRSDAPVKDGLPLQGHVARRRRWGW